jgi:hypothetical protein
MSHNASCTCVVITTEIEIPGDLSDELQDAIADDLTCEMNIDRLQKMIKRWARFISGENCHIAIDVE